MLRIVANHSAYKDEILYALPPLCSDWAAVKRLWSYTRLILFLWVADLGCVAPVLAQAYTGYGRPPRNPLAMFRAWLAATVLGIDSPEKLAARLGTDALLATLCGFDPEDTPAGSTLRDFLRRFSRTMRRNQRHHCS